MGLTREQLLTVASFRREIADAFGPAMGGLHFDDNATPTDIVTQNVWVKASNASSLHSASGFDQPVDNRIRYTGLERARAAAIATLSFTCASNNQVLEFGFFVNGDESTASFVRTKITTGTDVQTVTIMSHPTLSPGDYLEVWCRNTTSNGDITIVHGHVHVLAFYP